VGSVLPELDPARAAALAVLNVGGLTVSQTPHLPQVEDVLSGEDGLLRAMGRGSVLVVMGTVSPVGVRELGEAVPHRFLEDPAREGAHREVEARSGSSRHPVCGAAIGADGQPRKAARRANARTNSQQCAEPTGCRCNANEAGHPAICTRS